MSTNYLLPTCFLIYLYSNAFNTARKIIIEEKYNYFLFIYNYLVCQVFS